MVLNLMTYWDYGLQTIGLVLKIRSGGFGGGSENQVRWFTNYRTWFSKLGRVVFGSCGSENQVVWITNQFHFETISPQLP